VVDALLLKEDIKTEREDIKMEDVKIEDVKMVVMMGRGRLATILVRRLNITLQEIVAQIPFTVQSIKDFVSQTLSPPVLWYVLWMHLPCIQT